ncbi:MAG: PQQ-dependent sugar dehydrogenase [Chloroflexota bacterium]
MKAHSFRLILGLPLLLALTIYRLPPATAFPFTPQTLPPNVELDIYVENVTFPVAMAFASDGRLFFAERFVDASLPITGTIRLVENGVVQPQPFATLDLADSTPYAEKGLLGLALDPDFADNGYVYTYRTAAPDAGNPAEHGELIRYTAQLSGTNWLGVDMTILVDDLPVSTYCCHNGGVIHFGPDSKLYLSIGDNSNSNNGQNLSTKASKLLRYNPDGTIPADNPFVNTPGADPAIYAYGLRNVFGYDWHPLTSELYASENGPDCNDELNLITAGGNYGWALSYQGGQCVMGVGGTIDPLVVFDPPVGLTGVAFYTSEEIPDFTNHLFLGSWTDGNLYQVELPEGGGEPVVTTLLTNCGQPAGDLNLLDVVMGPAGDLYFSCQDDTFFPARPQTGAIYRLQRHWYSYMPLLQH